MTQALPWIAAGLVLLGLLAACRSTPPEDPAPEPAVQREPLAHEPLLRGNLSAVREPEVAVARTPQEWLVLWRRHSGLQLPGPELPEVDFEQHMVVATFLGERPTGGYQLDVERVLLEGTEGATPELVVVAHETRPEDGSLQPQMLVAPFHMVLVPRRDAPARLALQ